MNKFICFFLVVLSLPLIAQDNNPALEFDDDSAVSNPLENNGIDSTASEILNQDPVSESPVMEEPSAEDPALQEPVDEKDKIAEPEKTEEKVEEKVESNLDEEEMAKVEEVAPVVVAPTPTMKDAGTPVLTMEEEMDQNDRFKIYESHWFSTFGFEAMEYVLPFEYNGDKEDFHEESRQLYGGRVGFGGELYLGAGFMTSTRVDGYYMGTLFEKAQTADPQYDDVDISAVKDEGQIYGVDVVQTLSWIFDFKTKNPFMNEWAYMYFEPFVEAGIGKAWAYNKKDYFFDANVPATTEEYDQSFTDELTNVRVGGGINITSGSGFFLYLKATQNRYDITKRRSKGYYYTDGNNPTSLSGGNPSTDLDPIMVYSMGGGYRF